MKKLILGSALAALAVFVWGFLFWGLSGLPLLAFADAADDDALATSLREALPASGSYLVPPYPASETEEERWAERRRSGPIALIHYRAAGAEPHDPMIFVEGYAHMLLSVVLMAALLRLAAPALPTYGARLKLVAVAGLAAAVFSNLGDPVWWQIPWGWSLLEAVYDFTSWVVAGLVLSRFAR